mmetsp:Transcript_57286/g.95197  ORF Transcript_57286/g.95197 Transcript_57286/m.95197 type:complete len:464 (-) Transcript_57286:147-1538(-)|eukprot:CAMPEP_0202712756 /NCGR_PEP_ID=MMETSP1385-20130828/45033_1 /ASSEMBLY_ACC=CAM_ASM_000861 /TAXON_ID=933848 /ORGANISM="Elphidium margaritaceum" /LENGTH=463 /DNA_ID=CAMNT_0049372885 /DNA_START=70 /DNA_END=1461 /DNA_ORIENTATION=-
MIGQFRQMLSSNLTLDAFVSEALQWPNTNWKGFTAEWKYRDVMKMLPKYRNAIDSVLSNTLDPKAHSIAYSYLLGFKSTEKLEDPTSIINFMNQVMHLVKHADPKQISLCPRPFTDALRVYVDFMKRDKNFMPLISTLKRCIDILKGDAKNTNILTFAHCDFMYCCVETYCYHQAFPIVNQDIVQVQGDGCIRSVDNLRYFYYCGLVHIGMKNYKPAMECLTMVCTAPSESLSLIQIDAYKKYILISLIRKQHLVSLPRYTPRILTRYFPKFCNEYLELNSAFDSNANSEVIGHEKLKKIIEKNAETYLADFNYGLVKKVVRSCQKNSVKKLTSVYTKLSVSKVADLCKFENAAEAKDIVLAMIENGDLAASIDADGVVTFYDGSITQSDKEMLDQMQSGIEKTLNLWNGLDRQQLEVKQSKEFVEKSLNLPTHNLEADMQQQFLLQSAMGGMGHFFRGGGGI